MSSVEYGITAIIVFIFIVLFVLFYVVKRHYEHRVNMKVIEMIELMPTYGYLEITSAYYYLGTHENIIDKRYAETLEGVANIRLAILEQIEKQNM